MVIILKEIKMEIQNRAAMRDFFLCAEAYA
jgi:hypothetical protein